MKIEVMDEFGKIHYLNEDLSGRTFERLFVINLYTIKYIKHEGNIYYFNQVDKDGKVGYEITYDENTEKNSNYIYKFPSFHYPNLLNI